MKKLMAWCLSMVMLLSMTGGIGVTAQAAEVLTQGSCGKRVTYAFEEESGTLTVSGTGAMTDYRKHSLSPFAGLENIKAVVIENGVTAVGDNAFYECAGIKTVSFPSTLKRIGEQAFWYTLKLNSIAIPSSVKSIGYNAFSYSGYYNKADNWSDGVLYIGDCLVATNDDLEGAYAVKKGTRLIAQSAFFDCRDVTSVTLPGSLTAIDKGTFNKCTDLASVKIPASVTTIGESAFFGCKALKKLVLPRGVKTIGAYAFNCCDGLTAVTIPLSVKKIDFGAFYPCEKIKSVTYAGTKAQWDRIALAKSNAPLYKDYHLHCTDDIKGIKLKAGKRAFKAAWKQADGATGYEVRYSLKQDMTGAVVRKVKANRRTLKVKKLKKGKKYYVSVRAITGKKTATQWSKPQAVKTK